MILVYTSQRSPRLRYACQVLFDCILHTKWQVTDSQEEFEMHSGARINYSSQDLPDSVRIVPQGMMIKKDVADIEPSRSSWDELPVLFPTAGDIPFDIFAATFFLAARYEEYLPYRADKYGRFQAEDSIAFKQGFLDRPIIDEWAIRFKERLLSSWSDLTFGQRQYNFISTVDIDSAFAYRYKGFMRTVGGFAKDFLALDMKNASNRFKTILGKTEDTFNTYDRMIELHRRYGVEAVFFYLLADYGLNDKNVPYTSNKLRETIKCLDDYFQSGIHPGFMSNSEHHRLKEEIKRLSEIIHRPVAHSRQHFLMMSLPDTQIRLVNEGIEHDYTMGFASQPGFRMGTCTAIPFFNLRTNQVMPLTMHPFAVMDATLNMYQELSPAEAIQTIRSLVDKVRSVDGTFISLWHNESLSESWKWEGWSVVFEEMLQHASV